MATAAVIGGGLMLAGGIASGIGAGKAAKEQTKAAQAQLEASQAFQAQQQANAQPFINNASLAQNAQLGLLGVGGDPNAAQGLLNSPLVQALNEQNQQNINAQAAASGVSGGNLLTALQDANTSTILQAGLQGLGGIAGQGLQGGLGFTGMSAQGLGMANQAQGALGQAQGAQAAIPWMTGANLLNQGSQLASFASQGGFGMPSAQSAPAVAPATPALGAGAPIPQSGRIF